MKIIVQEARNSDYNKQRADSILEALRLKRCISLSLDICSICNLNCSFCYVHSGELKNLEGQEGLMDEKLYYKIIGDIADSGYKLKALHFSGWGEPLIQKKLPEMISFAHKSGIAERLILVTNGILMNEDVFEQLLSSGLDEIRISLDTVDRESYIKIKGHDKLQTVLKNIDYAINRLSAKDKLKFYIKIPGDASEKNFDISNKDMQDVIDRFKNIKNPNVNIILQPLFNTHGTVIANHKPCELVYSMALVRFDGRIGACCLDIFDNLNIGNFNNESFSQIMNGEKLRQIRKIHISGNLKKLPQCISCGFRTALDLSPYVENIDKLL